MGVAAVFICCSSSCCSAVQFNPIQCTAGSIVLGTWSSCAVVALAVVVAAVIALAVAAACALTRVTNRSRQCVTRAFLQQHYNKSSKHLSA